MLTISGILTAVERYLSGEESIRGFRDYIFSFYEREEDIKAESESTETVVAVLSAYLEYEEAYSDQELNSRFRRLQEMLRNGNISAEHVFFALDFDKIKLLLHKLSEGVISRGVLEEQIRKLSPVTLDWNRIIFWSHAHRDAEQMDLDKIS